MAPDSQPPVKRFGPYEVRRELGRGEMGVVYEALEPGLSRPVALRILPPHLTKDATYVERFLREGRAAAQLRHANIVPIHDVGEHEGILFVSMEYVQGELLSDLVAAKGKLDGLEAMTVVHHVSGALVFAHGEGIVHGHITPRNIIRESSGTMRVMDFGLAQEGAGNQEGESGKGLETLGYLSPEACEGRDRDARCDIYSLGVVLFEILTGRLPFEADSADALVHEIVHGPFPDVMSLGADVPPPIAKILERMTANNRDDRYGSAGALLRDVDHVLTRLRVPVSAVPRSKSVPVDSRRVAPSPHYFGNLTARGLEFLKEKWTRRTTLYLAILILVILGSLIMV